MTESAEIDTFRPEIQARFPRHGSLAPDSDWAEFVFPIIQVLHDVNAIREARGARPVRKTITDQNRAVFIETLRNAIVALRELAALIQNPPPPAPASFEEASQGDALGAWVLNRWRHEDLLPLFVDLGFVHLGRLADLLAASLARVLFRGATFEKMTDFRSAVDRGVDRLHPILPKPERIAGIFKTDSADMVWLDRLKGEFGFRDVAIHGFRDRVTLLHGQTGPNTPAQMYAMTRRASDGGSTSEGVGEFIGGLRECYRDFCAFLTKLVATLGATSRYQLRDSIVFFGSVAATIHFWPAVLEDRPA